MDQKIFSKEYRHYNLKQITDFDKLNSYLWHIEKLSKSKGGQFTQMYNEDIDFILNSPHFMTGGGILGDIFGGIFGKSQKNKFDETINPNTEQCVKNIKSVLGDKSPCNQCNSNKTCEKKIGDMGDMQAIINNIGTIKEKIDPTKHVDKNILQAMTLYIDVLFCCGKQLYDDKNELKRAEDLPGVLNNVFKKSIFQNNIFDKSTIYYLWYLKRYVKYMEDKEPSKINKSYILKYVSIFKNKAIRIFDKIKTEKLSNKDEIKKLLNEAKVSNDEIIALQNEYEKSSTDDKKRIQATPNILYCSYVCASIREHYYFKKRALEENIAKIKALKKKLDEFKEK